MRLAAVRLLHALTGRARQGTRVAMTDQRLNRLAERRRLVVIGEAQNLNRDCFEYLRHLHTRPGDPIRAAVRQPRWEVLAHEPMLRSPIYRRVAFAPLTEHDMTLILSYHPIYTTLTPSCFCSSTTRPPMAPCAHRQQSPTPPPRSPAAAALAYRPQDRRERDHAPRPRPVSPSVDVIADRDDDTATTRAMHTLAGPSRACWRSASHRIREPAW